MSESQTCATVVKMSISRTIIAVRSITPGSAVQSDEKYASPAARTGDCRGGCVSRPAGLDHDVESDPVAQLEQEFGQVVPRRVRDLLRSERGRRCQSFVIDVDRDNAAVLCTA